MSAEIKTEIKTEDELEAPESRESSEHKEALGQAEQVKVEEKGSRKRPHEDSRGYNYYAHRDEKR